MSVPSRERHAVIERDSHRCKKCGRGKIENVTLNAHHIIAKMDGGVDDAKNLITLCHVCHAEWHQVAELTTTINFADWLELPTYAQMIALYKVLKTVAPDYWTLAQDSAKTWNEFRWMKLDE